MELSCIAHIKKFDHLSQIFPGVFLLAPDLTQTNANHSLTPHTYQLSGMSILGNLIPFFSQDHLLEWVKGLLFQFL